MTNNDIESILAAPFERLPSVDITDDQILAALMGETVVVKGPKYEYTVIFDGKEFVTTFYLGILNCNEDNLRKFRFI